jgi:hypothetical protein
VCSPRVCGGIVDSFIQLSSLVRSVGDSHGHMSAIDERRP